MITRQEALPGRSETQLIQPAFHEIFGRPLTTIPVGAETAWFGLGCYWGAERIFWEVPGVVLTVVGYAGGYTPNPTYDEVCSGLTGHAEVVQVSWNPEKITYGDLLDVFFENHDPTQGMRQGPDIGTQYRSVIFPSGSVQRSAAHIALDRARAAFSTASFPPLTTQIVGDACFYPAENAHQQFLAKNPDGHCPVNATGVSCRST
jgi:peptide-methionine (S)-S-oxide reductase